AADLDKTFPLDTLVQRYWIPSIPAAVALPNKDPKRALELLKITSAIELSQATQLGVVLCPAYLRGEAYLMLHDGNAAAGEFQKFLDHRGLVGTSSGVRWPVSGWPALTPCRATPSKPASHIRTSSVCGRAL